MSTLKHISAKDFKANPNRFQIIMDVREPDETAAGYIPGAIFEPLNSGKFKTDLASGAFNRFKTKAILVYCKSGVRSKIAGQVLCDDEFPNVTMLDGGYDAYIQARR